MKIERKGGEGPAHMLLGLASSGRGGATPIRPSASRGQHHAAREVEITASCFYVGGKRLGLMLGLVIGNWTGPGLVHYFICKGTDGRSPFVLVAGGVCNAAMENEQPERNSGRERRNSQIGLEPQCSKQKENYSENKTPRCRSRGREGG